ncbi:glycosyltransferase [Latilactobacillus graminis]|uniref:Glycosyl transferase, group 2 family protein n=2 Tax=Latilactobacillus graminis TaxID=60519 RepID=A0AA89I0A8_9LACO|nr:glycosyltransferase [Latilactobacillus graminis]KRM20958.1 glycosyl transferase, group 2 family protein [Latilactobacillus graminis DSM 20719]QFP79099.1 glycosyltransferase [Latilactobacillus graminis]
MEKLVVVIVTYRRSFTDTPSADLLLKYARNNQLTLVIYDNEKVGAKIIGKNIINIQNNSNKGLVKGYNVALEAAIDKGIQWLLLLDHDTKLSTDYFDELFAKLDSKQPAKAILPTIISNEVTVSPLESDKYISLRTSQVLQPGQFNGQLMAINSGSTLSVEALQSIGGFNEAFPLDFLDHWLFWRLNQIAQPYLLLETQLKHSLSVQTPNTMSTTRYASILAGETLYYSQYNIEEFKNYRKHLLLRIAKQFLKFKNRQLWRMSLKTLSQLRRGK